MRRAIAGAFGALILIALVVLLLTDFPLDPDADRPAGATKIYDRNGALLYEVIGAGGGRHTDLPLSGFSPWLIAATVATEDAGFYANPGVDLAGILRAARTNWEAGMVAAGGSTITQQVARMVFLAPEERADRSLPRKAKEALLALRLNQRYGKDRILALYLNRTYYGNLAYGAEAAAQTYFGKPARDLDLAEAALLAGLPQAPARYNPLADPAAAGARQRQVLDLMVRAGAASQADADRAAAEPLHFAAAPFPIRAPHFVAFVRDEVERLLGPEAAAAEGLRIRTTLDLGQQTLAEATVRRQVARLADHNVTNAALVALDPATGQVLAMVGSADYFDPRIDGAVNVATSPRQTGSAIKPLVYATAFERGYSPGDPVDDLRTSYPTAEGIPYVPVNYDGIYHGRVPMREALAGSYNSAAVAVLQRVGIPAFLSTANVVGLGTLGPPERHDLALALGSSEISLLRLAAAYSPFPSGGLYRPPAAVLEVQDAAGHTLWRWQDTPAPAFSPQTAYLVTDVLADPYARLSGFGENNPLVLTRPAAAKTGTTTDFRDNWTVGFTPDLLVGVWAGNADNSPMHGVSGITGAALIWHDFMEDALRGHPALAFSEPPGLVRREYCLDGSGLDCEHRRWDLFRASEEDLTPGPFPKGKGCPDETGLDPSGFASYETDSCLGPGSPLPFGEGGSGGSGPPPTLRFAEPDRNGQYRLSPRLPVEQQAIPISLIAPPEVARIALEMDGVPRELARPFAIVWAAAPGAHHLRAAAYTDDGRLIGEDALDFHVSGTNSE